MIDINGIKYRSREKKPLKLGKTTSMILAMADFSCAYENTFTHVERPHVNIIEEYKLILQKKSKLPRSQREWVIGQFKRNYTPIKIARAAIRKEDEIYLGASHGEIIKAHPWKLKNCEQGFLTDTGEFVDRKEAAVIAFNAGQIKEKKDILYSENLILNT
ncbi:MAG: hypothetical protein PHW73_00590 [Atribacterota bacterium]|nr:hypothetical protein [Atribacterota bacterium]